MRKVSATFLTSLAILSMSYEASASDRGDPGASAAKVSSTPGATTAEVRRAQRAAAREGDDLSKSKIYGGMRQALEGSPGTTKTLHGKFDHLRGRKLDFNEPSAGEKAITQAQASLKETDTKEGGFDDAEDVQFKKFIENLKQSLIPNGEDTFARIEAMVGTIPEGETEAVRNLAIYIDRLHSAEKGEELDNLEDNFYTAADDLLDVIRDFSFKKYDAIRANIKGLKRDGRRYESGVHPDLPAQQEKLQGMVDLLKPHKNVIESLVEIRRNIGEFEGVAHYQEQVERIVDDYGAIMKIKWQEINGEEIDGEDV